MRILLALLAALAASTPTAQSSDSEAPTLAELAAKEKTRREAVATQSRVVTNAELGYRSQGPSPWDTPEPEAAAEAVSDEAEEPEKTPEEVRAEKGAEIQKQIDAEGQRMTRIREVMAESQRQLSDLTVLTFGARRANLLKLIEDGEVELAKSEEELDGLAREARFAGLRVRLPR